MKMDWEGSHFQTTELKCVMNKINAKHLS